MSAAMTASPVSRALAAACFSPSYASARSRFLLAADRAGARTDSLLNRVAAAPDGSVLSTDVAILGPADAEAALLVVSGTHGPEGYVGSAAQVALLEGLALTAQRLAVRLVLVHAINPWGFAHGSRTTEHNVDLNRNFIDWSVAAPANPAYAELHPYLCPADDSPEAGLQAQAGLDAWIASNGHAAFVDVTARGQYSHADGVHYGGTAPQWSNQTLATVIARHLAGVRRLALIDWHTGLGEHGEPFFLCFNEPGSAGWDRACAWWGRDRVDTQGGFEGAARPRYQGLLFHGVQRCAAQADVTGAVIEFGTLAPDLMRRALQADQRLKSGAPLGDGQRQALRAQVLEAFSPASAPWQCSVLAHAIQIQQAALRGIAAP